MKLILDCKDCGSDLEKCKCTDNIFDFTNINTPEKRLATIDEVKTELSNVPADI
jgi:hypothetical protein